MKAKCSVRDCDDPPKALGMCSAHYQYVWSWHRAGLRRAYQHRSKLVTRQELIDSMAAKQDVVTLPKRKKA